MVKLLVKHGGAFLASEHSAKLFRKMFPDFHIAKEFACGITKGSKASFDDIMHLLVILMQKVTVSELFSLLFSFSKYPLFAQSYLFLALELPLFDTRGLAAYLRLLEKSFIRSFHYLTLGRSSGSLKSFDYLTVFSC